MDNGIDIVLDDEELEVELQEDFLKGEKGEPGYTPVKGIDYFTEAEIDEITKKIIVDVNAFDIAVVDKLPTENIRTKVIYFVPSEESKEQDVYDEYIYIENKWEFIGSIKVDLSDYCQKSEMNKLINALSNNKETVTGENITVNDSAEERVYEFNISGNSKQETREGYNLIGLKDGTYTFNGITAVVLNGEATLSGTATTVTFASIPLINEITLKQSTLYQMYVFNNITTDAVIFRPNETDGNRQAPFTSINNVVGYQNNQTSVTLTKVTFRIADGINLSNIKCKPMIIEGSNTTLAYEQYGVSPSPDYPSGVKSCGDNVNLFNVNGATYNGTLEKYNNGFTLNKKTNRVLGYTVNIPAGTYTLSYDIAKTTLTSNLEVTIIGGTTQTLKMVNGKNTFTTTSNINQLYFYVSTSEADSATISIDNIKIEKGTIATPYSFYGQGCINEVICNKNLFDYDKTSYGFYNSSGKYEDAKVHRISNFLKAESNKQYIASTNRNIGYLYIYEFDINKNLLKRSALTNVKENLITTTNSTKYIRVSYNIDNYIEMTIDKLKEIQAQLEEGSIVTDCEEHKEQVFTIPTQQPMRSIGDVRDTFVKVNGKWFERHNINRIILDGTKLFTIGTPSNRFYLNITLNNLNYLAKSNYFISGEENQFNVNGTVVLQTDRINLMTDKFTNQDDFNACILEQYNAGTPVYVDYILATPNDIECTFEQIAKLNEINNAKTYKGTTHIYSTDNVDPNVEVRYFKDIEIMMNK